MDLTRGPPVMEGMAHLGYPAYFVLILGTWKVLGTAAVLAPGLPRVKEWAYAGMFFDLTGAAASHTASGDPAAKILMPLILVSLVAASWKLRPANRMLSAPAQAGNTDGASDRRTASSPVAA
jgi:hypothetical protein